MAKKTEATSVSMTLTILKEARRRSQETHRGNFSAYIEGLVTKDLALARVSKKKEEQ